MTASRLAAVLAAVVALSAASAAAAVPQPFPRATPESQGVPSEAVLDLVERLHAEGDWVHAYMLIRHGKVVAEGWWAPYSADERHQLYSASKAFAAMGIGYAAEERLLTLNDRVDWFFPWYVPAPRDPRAAAMRVRDLMAMSSGLKSDPFDAMMTAPAGEQVRRFYETPMDVEPGIFFRYMSGNTAMLAQILRRVTGEPDLVKYLDSRLFSKLGIEDMLWARQPDGTVAGGSGFELRTEDFAKVGQLLLQNGVWKGERLLPLWWVKQATSCQTPYGNVLDPVLALHVGTEGWEDWEVGYGYQLWMGRHETFRLCGAFGQIVIVMPSEDVVFVSNAGGGGANSKSVNAFYDAMLGKFSQSPLPENPSALKRLRERSAALSITAPAAKDAAKPTPGAAAMARRGWCAPEVPADAAKKGDAAARTYFEESVKAIAFDEATDTLVVSNSFGRQELKVGRGGKWERGELEAEKLSALTLSRVPGGKQPVGVSGGWTSPTELKVRICFVRSPAIVDVVLDCGGDAVSVRTECQIFKRYRHPAEK